MRIFKMVLNWAPVFRGRWRRPRCGTRAGPRRRWRARRRPRWGPHRSPPLSPSHFTNKMVQLEKKVIADKILWLEKSLKYIQSRCRQHLLRWEVEPEVEPFVRHWILWMGRYCRFFYVTLNQFQGSVNLSICFNYYCLDRRYADASRSTKQVGQVNCCAAQLAWLLVITPALARPDAGKHLRK